MATEQEDDETIAKLDRIAAGIVEGLTSLSPADAMTVVTIIAARALISIEEGDFLHNEEALQKSLDVIVKSIRMFIAVWQNANREGSEQ
jgi:hypothetical protein